jgi:hypothetical protein
MPRTPRRSNTDPFGAGPWAWARQRLPSRPLHAWQAALGTAAIGWAPLVALAAAEHLAIGPTAHTSMLLDYAAHGRYLLGAPAFAAAGFVALPEFARVVRQFADARMVADHERARYDALVASTRRLLASGWLDVVLLAAAIGVMFIASSRPYSVSVESWARPGVTAGVATLSLAGWWRMAVSQPLSNLLLCTWLWRLLVWTRFLHCTMRMDLRLVASHPDRLGGLGFVLVPLHGLAIVAFGLGAVAAGAVTERVLVDGAPLESYRLLIGTQVVVVLVLVAGPALQLIGPLTRLKIWGTFHYGHLASDVGHAFQQRWLTDRSAGPDALGAPDFSATTDLYSVAANVNAINPFVFDLRTVLSLAAATLLPYIPVVVAVLPFEDVIRFALKASV